MDEVTIQRAKPGRQWALSAVALGAAIVGAFVLTRVRSEAQSPAAASPSTDEVTVSANGAAATDIRTEVVHTEVVADQLRTTGLVSYPADRTVKVVPRLQGRVRKMLVQVGDTVTAGQPIAILESSDAASAKAADLQSQNRLQITRTALERQQRLFRLGTPDVASAEAAVDQAKVAENTARELLTRTKYQAKIGGFTEKPVEDAQNAMIAAQTALSQARSDLALATKELDRKRKLFEIGVASRSDLDAAQNAYEKSVSSVNADEESYQLARQAFNREKQAFDSKLYSDQQVIAAESALRQAQLQLAAANRTLKFAKAQILRDLQQAESDFHAATIDAENSRRNVLLLGSPNFDGTLTIAAPVSGTVIDKTAASGQLVDTSQLSPWQLCVIADTREVWVDGDVFESEVSRVHVGQRVQITISATGSTKFEGLVKSIAPTLDRSARSVKVRVVIDNASGLLKDGEFAELNIEVGSKRSVITIPSTGVFHDGDSDFAYVAAGKKYKKTQIKVGQRFGDRIEVISGLTVGQTIVSHGAIFLGAQADGD